MPAWLTPPLFVLQMLLSFLATVLLIEGLYMLWRTRRGRDAVQLAARLHTLPGHAQHDPPASLPKPKTPGAVPALRRWLLPVPATAWLARSVQQAGLTVPLSRLLLLGLLLGLAGLLVGLWLAQGRSLPLGGLLPGLMLGGTLAALPLAYVVHRRTRRLGVIARQLPDALDLMVRSLRAGHSLGSGLKLAADQVGGPLALELRVLQDEVRYGVALPQALAHLLRRVPLTDLAFFTVAVQIQQETGGNLAEVLDKLSRLIRQRLHLHAKLRALTAEGRLSAWVLGLLPFALAGLLAWAHIGFIQVLWRDPIGIALTQTLLMVMLVGIFWLWRVSRVRI